MERERSYFIRDLIVKILLVLLFVFLLMWLLPMPNMKPLYDKVFSQNVSTMTNAAKAYYNTTRLPQEEGETKKLTLRDMLNNKMIIEFTDSDGKTCNPDASYVEVTKQGKEYVFKTNLSCSSQSDYVIEYFGCYNVCEDGKCETKIEDNDKKDVIEFFDSRSSSWDKEMETDDYKMNQILDAAQIESGKSVLDIACGTGVMIDYYIKRNVSDVTGVDISSKMIEIAENKFKKYDNINFICCDAETYRFNQKYDSIMVFNAFPHFVNPKALIKNLVKAVKSGGTVTVAHDRGRKSLDNHHKSVHASKISNGLMSEDDLEKIFVMAGITDIYKKSTDDIYIVSGKKI